MKTGGRAIYPPTPAPSTGRNAVTAYSVLAPIRPHDGWGRFAVRFAFSHRARVRVFTFMAFTFVFFVSFRRKFSPLSQYLVDDGDGVKLIGADRD